MDSPAPGVAGSDRQSLPLAVATICKYIVAHKTRDFRGMEKMNHELSIHVQEEMERRGIPLAVVEAVLAAPAQKMPEHGDVVCYQSKVDINQKTYLVRVMVNETATPPKVVTVYRTSKISKYWKITL
jgi:hypothetical protein